MQPLRLSIARDFSRTPGPRHESEGEFSGELFYKGHLHPSFCRAREGRQKLEVDLDGTAGFASSFLEETFGGLARDFGAAAVRDTVTIKSLEEPYLVEEIWGFVEKAEKS